MEYGIEEKTVEAVVTSTKLETRIDSVDFNVNVGESAKMDVTKAVNYIQSGRAEIGAEVADGINQFNANAVNKTNAFNTNATNKTGDFNTNATNKTTDFNNNYTEKKNLIDAEVNTAKQWAIGEPSEPSGGSSKYWAAQTSSYLSGFQALIPAAASSSNQLTDKAYVDAEDISLQSQIDALVVSSDVFDIVGTYAELQAYDISTVPVNDIIKVLVDNTHSNAATYYRCVESGGVKSWSYIGSEGAYYTKAEADSLFATPSDIGNATITISQGGVSKGTFTTNQSGNATIDVDAATIPSNMVTTDTDQNITGVKRFSPNDTLIVENSSVTKGTNPASTQYLNISLMENEGVNYKNRVGCFETTVNTDGSIETSMRAYKNTADSGTNEKIAVIYPASGSAYTYAPTPTTTDLSNKIATTEHVRKQPGLLWYGTSSSAADATEKVVVISGYTAALSPEIGQCLVVKPSTTSTVADSTLKIVNSSSTVLFAAKTMRYNDANITTSTDSVVWNSSYPSIFMYDGTYWVFLGHGVDSNTTYSAMSVSEGTTGTATSQRTMRADYLKQIFDYKFQTSGAGLATFSKATNGYYKFSNGLIIQWGVHNKTLSNNGEYTCPLPTSFTSTNYAIALTPGGWYNSQYMGNIGVTSKDASSFKYKIAGSDSSQQDTYFIAIGY